jgi:hypothetical protein
LQSQNSTSNQVAKRESTDLSALSYLHSLSPERLSVLTRSIAPGATQVELEWFLAVADHSGLDAFATPRQIACFAVGGDDESDTKGAKVPVIMIDGWRKMLADTGMVETIEIEWCGESGDWRDTWPDNQIPLASRATIWLVGRPRPVRFVAHYKDFVMLKRGSNSPRALWARMPRHMLAIRAVSHCAKQALPAIRAIQVAATLEDEDYEGDSAGNAQRRFWAHGWTEEQVRIGLNAPEGSIAQAVEQRGGWARAESHMLGLQNALEGDRVRLQLNAGDGPDEFWEAAKAAGWDWERVLHELGCATLAQLEARVKEEGWPRLTLVLRGLITKIARDAVIEGQTSPEEREAEQQLKERVGVGGLLWNDDSATGQTDDDGYHGLCERCGKLPRLGEADICRECAEAELKAIDTELAAARADSTSAPTNGNAISETVAAAQGPSTSEAEQPATNEELSPDDELCPLCAERPVRLVTAEGIGICVSCFDARAVAMPADVRDYASFCRAASRPPASGGLGIVPAEINSRLGRVGWKDVKSPELVERWRALQLGAKEEAPA